MSGGDFTAVILAAGYGSRISEVTTDPKILLPLGDETILSRHLSAFAALGIRKVRIVVGYEKQKVMDAASAFSDRLELTFVANDDYRRKGNGYSLFLGIEEVNGPVLVFDGDLTYANDVLEGFIKAGTHSSVLVGAALLDDIECTKALVDARGFVRKTADKRAVTEGELARYRFAGEAMGVLKFSESDRRDLVDLCREFFADEKNLPLNWEHPMGRFFLDHDVSCYYEESDEWVEIDTPEDYAEAKRLFE